MKDSKCETIHTTNFIELIQTACLGPQQIHVCLQHVKIPQKT